MHLLVIHLGWPASEILKKCQDIGPNEPLVLFRMTVSLPIAIWMNLLDFLSAPFVKKQHEWQLWFPFLPLESNCDSRLSEIQREQTFWRIFHSQFMLIIYEQIWDYGRFFIVFCCFVLFLHFNTLKALISERWYILQLQRHSARNTGSHLF